MVYGLYFFTNFIFIWKVCWTPLRYHSNVSGVKQKQRQTSPKSKMLMIKQLAPKNLNQWRLCKEFHYWTLGWAHASDMFAVIMGALSFRQRNPRRFLIRACQVSIKEVPSPPRVSIEIGLTNKNSLAALFAQSGTLLCCVLASLLWGGECDRTYSLFLKCIYNFRAVYQPLLNFNIFRNHFSLAFKCFFPFIHLIHLYMTCTCTHYMQDQSIFVRQRVSSCGEIRTRWLLSESFGEDGTGP